MRSERRRIGWTLLFVVLLTVYAFVSGGCVSGAPSPPGATPPPTIYVEPGDSIQDIVDAIDPGTMVIVRDGTYIENVVLNKRLIIRSQNGSASTTVQAASASDHVFSVTADNVKISGFTVTGATDSHKAGIYLHDVHECTIFDNTMSMNYCGIWLYTSCTNNTLTGNIASNNRDGFLLDYSSHHNALASNTANLNEDSGIELAFSCNNTLAGNTASNNNFGIYLYSSSNNTLTSNTASDNNNGIYLYSSSNNNILMDNTAANNYVGIDLDTSSNNNTLTGNTVSNNTYGIDLDYSYNNSLTGNTASVNNENGIRLSYSSTNILTSNTANSNDHHGISLFDSCNNNTLTGNTACSNNRTGIYLRSSSNNTFAGNTASSNNRNGIYLYSSSNNNTLTGNIANSNSYEGIRLHSSSNNRIYNNYFNNTNNAWDDSTNIWNITKTPGSNIIGGSWLGGNYWSDYAGEDTNGDGLGDTQLPYNSSGNIVNGGDWLPLVATAPDEVIPLPEFADPPTDPDGDGLYEDLNGNGGLDFNDVVQLFKYLEWIEANEPITCFDFNGNGRLDFADIVELFKEV